MKPTGRPPKTQDDHELDGTLREDRHGVDSLAFRPEGYAEKPKDMGDHASWCWDFIIGDLHRERVACKIDTIKLSAACDWYQRYSLWGARLDQMSPDDSGMYRLAIVVNMAWKSFDGIASEFGLSPVSRMRMRMTNRDAPPAGVMTRKRG